MENEFELVESEDEVSDGDLSLESQIIKSTRAGVLNDPKILMAIEAIETGKVPPSAIMKRPGSGGSEIQYMSHTYATRTMNAAFRWLWDYEVVDIHVSAMDGSVATRCKMVVHIPMPDGSFYVRTITEIGSFEAYPKKDANGNVREPLEYTMNEADRIASSASRGLVKCMLRAFNVGLELSEKEDASLPVTNKDAWNALRRFGINQGLTREQIVEILKGKVSSDELADRFGEAYRLIYNAAHKKTEEDAPDELK